MGLLEIILLAIALAMDCLAVSIVSGVIMRRIRWRVVVWIAFLFGFFQAAMPFVGWLAMSRFARYVEAYDHWIAFFMLAFIGVKMIRESFLPEEEKHFDPCALSTQLLLAVATSIDALAVGITFACMKAYSTVGSMVFPLAVIFLVSFAFSVVGHLVGIRFGRGIGRRVRPELVGGIILVLIGLEILLTHLQII
ncbi:MAG: manganese efflux pump [Prevotella sp.]|nr:manganese efflux pump [Prevotella sp.]